MKRLITTVFVSVFSIGMLHAQEPELNPFDTLASSVAGIKQDLDVKNRLKITGYIQGQYQVADSAGQQAAFAGGNFPKGVDKRFTIRRGRIKFAYNSAVIDKGWSTSMYVLQFDVTERGLTIKDAYVRVTDPWSGWFNITLGAFDRPFGYEIGYSSSMRETPERARVTQTLFPGEREVGAMLTIQGPKVSNWNWLKLDAGFFNGNGVGGPGINVADWDNKKDFIGRISATRSSVDENIKYSFGASYYDGGFRIDTLNTWKMGKDDAGLNAFVLETPKSEVESDINQREYSKRQYYGVDAQVSVAWKAGLTTLRGEYIAGEQPGSSSSTSSPNNSTPVLTDVYNRSFTGGYFYFIQNIMQSPFQFVAKYDWYDPNTDVKGDDIGKSVTGTDLKKTGSADLAYSTVGLGLVYRWDANVKITAYYDMVKNETSSNLAGYENDLEDNVFTLRMQVKF
jgi:hypothetical protein